MRNRGKKLIQRISTATLYSGSQTASTVVSLFTTYLVFQIKPSLWGEFVEILIFVQLLSMVAGWGNRDYLLRHFSERPKDMVKCWNINISNRLLILIPSLLITIVWPFSWSLRLLIGFWILGQYISNSFQVLILYEKNFSYAFLVELLTSSFLPLLILFQGDDSSLKTILVGTVIGELLKSFAYLIYFYKNIKFKFWKFDKGELIRSTSFVIPSIVGTLQKRIDTYLVAVFLSDQTLAVYHLFLRVLSFGTNIISFTLNPYLKNFYRLKIKSINTLQRDFVVATLFFSSLYLILVRVFIEPYYHFTLPVAYYMFGGVIIISFSAYMLSISKLYRFHKQKEVAVIPFIILLLQVPMGYFLVKEHELSGAIWTNTFGQIVAVICFVSLDYKTQNSDG